MARTGTNKAANVKATDTHLTDSAHEEHANGLPSKAATVAIIGLGVALIEAELIPGMLLGIAAVLAPDLLPKIGRAIRPLVKGAVRAGYVVADRTRETVAEAGEHLQDIMAEVKSEAVPESGHAAPRKAAGHARAS
jgi:hypothetical protein